MSQQDKSTNQSHLRFKAFRSVDSKYTVLVSQERCVSISNFLNMN